MIDHDRLFKELISTFFIDFLTLFVPDLAQTIEPESIRFLQQEYFADLTSGEEKVVDLLVEVKRSGEDMAFLVHVETQSFSETNFSRRMFFILQDCIRSTCSVFTRSSCSRLIDLSGKSLMFTVSSFLIEKF